MLDSEKIIKGLTECVAAGLEKACPGKCPYFLQCFPDVGLATPFMSLMADALSLLKEQEAVPVIQREVMHMLVWCCGSCGVAITDGDKFCWMCGKKVKWDDRPEKGD